MIKYYHILSVIRQQYLHQISVIINTGCLKKMYILFKGTKD